MGRSFACKHADLHYTRHGGRRRRWRSHQVEGTRATSQVGRIEDACCKAGGRSSGAVMLAVLGRVCDESGTAAGDETRGGERRRETGQWVSADCYQGHQDRKQRNLHSTAATLRFLDTVELVKHSQVGTGWAASSRCVHVSDTAERTTSTTSPSSASPSTSVCSWKMAPALPCSSALPVSPHPLLALPVSLTLCSHDASPAIPLPRRLSSLSSSTETSRSGCAKSMPPTALPCIAPLCWYQG